MLSKQATFDLPTGVLGLAAGGDGRMLYAACMDGVYSVDAGSGEAERLYGHESYASGAAVVAGGGTLVTAGYDGTLRWFDLSKREPIRTVKAHDFWSWQLAASPDGTKVASATGQYLAGGYRYEPAAEREPSVKVFDSATGELLRALSHVPPVQSVAFSPDGRFLAAANLVGEIRVWDLETGDLAATWTTPDFTSWGIIKSHCHIGGIYALAFPPDGNDLLAAGMGQMRDPMAGNGRQLWQRFAWRESPPRKVDETHDGQSGEGLMEALAVAPSGGHFVMAGRLRGGEWNVAAFDLATGERLAALNIGGRLTRAVYSADGSKLFLARTNNQEFKPDGDSPAFGRIEVLAVAA